MALHPAAKRLWVADTLMKRAAAALGVDTPPHLVIDLHAIAIVASDHLEREGSRGQPRGGFWRDLMRACEALDLRPGEAQAKLVVDPDAVLPGAVA